MNNKEDEPNGVKSSVIENKVKSEALKIDKTIEEISGNSLGKTTVTSKVPSFISKESYKNIKSYAKEPLTYETRCSTIQSKQTCSKGEDTKNQVNSVNSSVCLTINSENSNTTLVQNENIVQESNENEKTSKFKMKDSKNKEKAEVEENLKEYISKFKSRCTLVKNQRKQLETSVKELSKISIENLTNLIKKKDQQFKSDSKDEFFLKLRQVEVKLWGYLKDLLKYNLNSIAGAYKAYFKDAIQFYDSLIDLLEKLVSLCADPPKSLKIKKDKLAEIKLDKDAVDGNLTEISGIHTRMANLVNEVKSEIEKFFEPDISDIKSLLDLF